MAQITGQAGVNLSQELANYLSAQQGNLTSEQIASIINQYLVGGDKLAAQQGQVTTGLFKRFTEFDQITGKIEVVTTGLWSGDTGSLTEFYTSSTQATSPSSEYYLNVYDEEPTTTGTIQYALAYGHKTGGGSTSLSVDDNSTQATKATYAQYAQILLDEDESLFTFTDGTETGGATSNQIYVINVARSRYKEKMDPGNWSLVLSGSDGSSVKFIDDSGKKFSDTVGKAGRIFNVAEGLLNLGTENEATVTSVTASNGQGYGLFYPDQGIIVLNPTAVHDKLGNSVSSSLFGDAGAVYTGNDREGKNQFLLHHFIESGSDFQARRTENVSTAHYFVRATNREFNFSNNPTFTTGSNGRFTESSFERDPRTFITTVGLYNNSNELLAVAKTSQPIPKSFDKEVLIKVKLDF